ncbi:MAG: threonine-phosphate decarboxylase CobD [Woeseiaceae bacterium]
MSNKEFKHEGLKHGGRILAAAEKYHIAKDDWTDLSTGLNPNGWPVPNVPADVWQSLPEENDGLQTAACKYYGCQACLPVAGSQAAIQTLPTLRSHSKVGIISPTYAEHEYNWKQAGHDVVQLSIEDVEHTMNRLDVLVVINPNNPTGDLIEADQLLGWHQQLSSRGGWLVVDEAFMDMTPDKSLVLSGIKPGLIILRSMGKFFGIAGIRCGFVISDNEFLQRLAKKLGPWSLAGPTRYIAQQALLDERWQNKTQYRLNESSERLQKILSQAGLAVKGGTALFQWLEHTHAEEIYETCAKKGLLLRFFEKQTKEALPSLRFGLPGNEKQWQQLSTVLLQLSGFIATTKKKKNYA